MPDRVISCEHCGVHITYDVTATGPLGGWRSPDGLACTHYAGHTPARPRGPKPQRPGY